MAERGNFVPIKFPLYIVEAGEREVDGNLTMVQPFVELWRVFDISTQKFFHPESKFCKAVGKQIHLGLRIQDQEDIIAGSGANYPDPVRLYRALQILNRIDRFPLSQDDHITLTNRLYLDAGEAYSATGYSSPLRHHRYLRNRFKSFIGEGPLQEAIHMNPPNLLAVVENLYRQKVTINGETLEREIRRERIETNPLYEEVISKTRLRKKRDRKSAEGFWRVL